MPRPTKSAPAKGKRAPGKSQPALPTEVSDEFQIAARVKQRARRKAQEEPLSSSDAESSGRYESARSESPLQKFSRDLEAKANSSSGKGKASWRGRGKGANAADKGADLSQAAAGDGLQREAAKVADGAADHGAGLPEAAARVADKKADQSADLSQAAAGVASTTEGHGTAQQQTVADATDRAHNTTQEYAPSPGRMLLTPTLRTGAGYTVNNGVVPEKVGKPVSPLPAVAGGHIPYAAYCRRLAGQVANVPLEQARVGFRPTATGPQMVVRPLPRSIRASQCTTVWIRQPLRFT